MQLVAQELDELLDVDWLLLTVEVSLGLKTSVVNQVVGVGDHTGHSSQNMVVDLIELSGLSGGDKQLGDFLLLSAEDHTVFGEDSDD